MARSDDASDRPPVLETDALTYRLGDRTVLDAVSVAVADGETLAVVGPSGAGKSTLLRLLVRLDEPDAGTVRFEGRDYRTLDPRTLRERVGLVPQQSALVDGTVRENITLGPRLRDEPVDDAAAERLLVRLGLSGTMERDVNALSGGEAQRVALARTLVNDPDVLLLDEPTASLDADTEATVETVLSDLVDEYSLTAVVVTHDIAQAARLASDALVFDGDGGVERESTARLAEVDE
ncbi:putative ABC transport system ATP-binding protein [Halarchaeum solikamskense]|uniref:ABC transporter ATP-binding protein n=1 Tax=Halarchaeum nitratireducens TaxID=489913 RepID=UPI001B3B18CC|nr:ATP-binding cassette domain-containing protein [Halarchaeum solikamskense]MBP2252659.1 putative ABC transport system ATP-binding protein [Halarchaeum solikamskense]